MLPKNDNVRFQKQRFSSEVISAKRLDCSKAKFEVQSNKSKTTFFLKLLKLYKIDFEQCIVTKI